jgi:hypothetical protein
MANAGSMGEIKIIHMKKYFLHDGNQQLGPFDIGELKLKTINKDTRVWSEGMSDWAKAEDIDELQGIFAQTPPPFNATNNSAKKNTVAASLPQKKKSKVWIVILVILLIGIVGIAGMIITNNPNAVPGIKVEINTPKPVVISSSADGHKSGIFNARTSVKATVQNQGGDGNVLVTFYVTQGGNRFDKSKSLYLSANQTEELEMTFEEVTYIDGDITYSVDAIAQ